MRIIRKKNKYMQFIFKIYKKTFDDPKVNLCSGEQTTPKKNLSFCLEYHNLSKI